MLTKLTGTVRTLRANSPNAYNVPWSNIVRYEPSFTNAGSEFGVDPALMAAMAIVESDGNQDINGNVITRDDGLGAGLSVGMLQVKPDIWQSLVPNANAYTADGNIRMGTAIMGDAIKKHGTWQDALVRVYFPQPDIGTNTSQSAYVKTVTSLMAEIANNTHSVPMTPQPTPTEGVIDPIRVVVGGDYPPINYGWRADVGLNYYCFGVNHGTTSCTQHTGVDVPVPDETALYSPAAGVVDCVGVNGTPRWDQGCGAYTDTGLGGPNSPIQGVGNITILLDSGHKLTLGHCSSSLVQPGDRVVAGQQVGRSGGQNGYHVHVEVSVLKDGTYWLMDPVAALREAMNGEVPTIICDRLPVPQPQEWDVFVPVKATRDGVPVLQRANAAGSCPVRRPLDKGEEFEGVMLVLGNDMKWYWVSRLGSRIPIDGTAAPNGPQIATA